MRSKNFFTTAAFYINASTASFSNFSTAIYDHLCVKCGKWKVFSKQFFYIKNDRKKLDSKCIDCRKKERSENYRQKKGGKTDITSHSKNMFHHVAPINPNSRVLSLEIFRTESTLQPLAEAFSLLRNWRNDLRRRDEINFLSFWKDGSDG